MINEILYIVFSIFFVWLAAVSYFLYKTVDHYRKLTFGVKGVYLMDVLEKILTGLKANNIVNGEIKKEIKELQEKSLTHIQKVGVLRFNPFSDTGGDQSFILALLDEKGNGVVLTSLHGRGLTRWYAKNVKHGKGVDYELSNEELKVIKQVGNIKE